MSELLLVAGSVVGIGALLILFTAFYRRGRTLQLRPLPAYAAVHALIGRAVESGNQIHLTLGQAGLTSGASPTSIAALSVLDALARDGCANATPPRVTVGEGTLLPAAQDSLLHAYHQAQFTSGFEPGAAEFIASEADPFTYAAGVTSVAHESSVSNNIAVGRFGTEIALIAAAAERKDPGQVIGTDDPMALALAAAVTPNLLIGEELLAAGAYLDGQPGQLAAIRAQDLVRLLLAVIMLGLAVYQFFTA